ncbi:MAG: substrate-binding domain-containing protein [Oscillospiraceae bacterium]|nr:substrate-binding domain-containing protein [Oscillospiraceae bacterium]
MARGRIAVLMPAVYDELDKELLSGIYTSAAVIGFDTLVFTAVSAENDADYTRGENNIYDLPFLTDIDGIILVPDRFKDKALKNDIVKRIEKSRLPCVAIKENIGKIQGVFLDQSKSIYDITEHLITVHGYRDILCLTGPHSNSEAEERAAGYIRAMKRHCLNSIDVIYGDFWRNSASELAKEIAEGKRQCPEAVVCTSDIMAVVLCEKLSEYGLNVPEDIAVTGYDGSVYTLLTRPPITTVCGGEKTIGMLAVKALAPKLGITLDIECNKQYMRICSSCGCHDIEKEKEHLLQYTENIVRKQLDRKTFMYSNYIAKMSDCESIPKFAAVLDSLRYLLPECKAINVCVCEDWQVEHPEYRKSGFSENMQLIYSEEQPGQLDFPLYKLLPCLNLPHEPQFWVISSIHYSDRIIGYIATSYDKAEQFAADEHYIGWCDAVGNGLDIVIKKSNTEYIWQKLEEKNMSDIYTGLHSRRGFVSKINAGDTIMLFSFPKRYTNTPYFVPIVSAVLRSDEAVRAAVYLGETVFAVTFEKHGTTDFTRKLCQAVSELGIYTSEDEIYNISDEISADTDMRLTELYYQLIERGTPRSSEAYSEIFSSLRKEMKYSPQNEWNITDAALRTGLSGSHFQRLYKKHFGVSFNEELITFRMDRAKYLLKNTSISVQRIAEECGYTNAAHFMRQFKDREKMSAGQYRKAANNE